MVTQRLVAKVFGFTFLAIGILGLIPNPLVGENALFQTNLLHDLVHLLSGAVALAVGFSAHERYAKNYHLTFGGIYAVVAILGLLGVGFVVDLLNINMADNLLHVVLAAGLLTAGFAIPVHEPRPARV